MLFFVLRWHDTDIEVNSDLYLIIVYQTKYG